MFLLNFRIIINNINYIFVIKIWINSIFFARCRNLVNVLWVLHPRSIINDQPSKGVHFSFVEIITCVRLGRNKILFYRFLQTSKYKLYAPTSSKLSDGLGVPSIHSMCVYSMIPSWPGLRVWIAQRSSSKNPLCRETVNEHFGVRSLQCNFVDRYVVYRKLDSVRKPTLHAVFPFKQNVPV